MAIEELLAEIKAKGFCVTQWRERMSFPANPITPAVPVGGWWCELKHPSGFRDNDVGDTALAALQQCYARALGKKGPENRPITQVVQGVSEETLEKLKNAKPHEVIEVTEKEMKAITKSSKKKIVDLSMLD